MANNLPLNTDGSIAAFDTAQVSAMNIQARGMTEGDHYETSQGPDGSYVTRKFACAWGQEFNTLLYFVGACTTYTPTLMGAPAVAISRMLPMVDPYYTNWVCTKCSLRPFGFTGSEGGSVSGTEPYPEYTNTDFTCVFELVPYALQTDQYVANNGWSELVRYVTNPGYPGAEITCDSQYVGLPGGILQYATPDGTIATGPAGTPIPYPPGFVEGTSRFKIVWRRVPQAAWGPTSALTQAVLGTPATPVTPTSRGYIGALNLTTFNDYPPLSLQLIGVEQRLLPDPTGLGYSWDLGYVIQHNPRPYGHTGLYYHNPGGGGIAALVVAALSPSGYYQALRPAAGTTTLTPAQLAANDNAALFPVREFANLFQVAL